MLKESEMQLILGNYPNYSKEQLLVAMDSDPIFSMKSNGPESPPIVDKNEVIVYINSHY